MSASLYSCGIFGEIGIPFFAITVGGSLLSVSSMLHGVELEDPSNCWAWFANGFWFTMLSITVGLVADYVALSMPVSLSRSN
jgi:4-hydroxybenzoate polyprenyltransferase